MAEAEQDTLWYHPDLDVFLNRWYANYEEAQQARERHGGFLLPYQNHFYVCQADVIQALGLDPEDQDWEKINWDAAQPAESEAFDRLRERREKVLCG
ncbi:MAG: hypothetical protein AABM67_13765 [Acidobacteriota bacterium]